MFLIIGFVLSLAAALLGGHTARTSGVSKRHENLFILTVLIALVSGVFIGLYTGSFN